MEPMVSGGESSMFLGIIATRHGVEVTVNRKARGLFSPLHENSSEHGVHVVCMRRHHNVDELNKGSCGGNFGLARFRCG